MHTAAICRLSDIPPPSLLIPPHLIPRLIPSHHLSSTSSIIGGTAYGQNITTATTGKYLQHPLISLSPQPSIISHYPIHLSLHRITVITRIGNGLLDIHHRTPTDFLPLRSPSRSRSSTSIGSAHSSISPEPLDRRSLDPGSREGGEHGAAGERRHREYCGGGVEWRLWGWINLVLDLRLRIQGDRKE